MPIASRTVANASGMNSGSNMTWEGAVPEARQIGPSAVEYDSAAGEHEPLGE